MEPFVIAALEIDLLLDKFFHEVRRHQPSAKSIEDQCFQRPQDGCFADLSRCRCRERRRRLGNRARWEHRDCRTQAAHESSQQVARTTMFPEAGCSSLITRSLARRALTLPDRFP